MSDIRDAFRALRATPIVTAVAVLSLALGIGANTAIFSILNTLLLRSLPVKDPQQLAIVATDEDRDSFTNPIWEQIRDRASLFSGAAAWSGGRFNTARSGETEFVQGLYVNGRFFDVFGVPPMLGRTFRESDDRRGGGADGPVAVISYDYWQQRFGGAADAIGKPLLVEGVAFTVVGVTPPEFFGPEVGTKYQVAVPLAGEGLIRGRDSLLDERSAWWLTIIVRRRADQSLEAATSALRGVQSQIREATIPTRLRAADIPSYLREPFRLVPAASGASYLRYRYERPLTTIMVVVALVLLIACANIANLQLARATGRRHELSVRRALGATRLRLSRLLLTESLLLSGCGALLGLLFAQWGSRVLVRQLSTTTNIVFLDLSIDWRVLGFTALVTIATALLFGMAPSLRAARIEPNEALKEQGRGIAGDARFGLGSLLVIVQVALSLVLVVAAGLFMRTFLTLTHQPLGFDSDRVLVASVNATAARVEPAERVPLFERLREAAAAVPGVAAAAVSAVTPISGSTWQYRIELPDGPPLPERERGVHVNIISSDFFQTYGTRLIAGRDFTKADASGAPPVVIVNEAFARKFLNGQNPIGKRVYQAGLPARPAVTREIVGYVQDAIYRNLRQAVPPTIYIPIGQQPEMRPAINISVRAASGSPALLTRGVAETLNRTSPSLAITFRPLAEQVTSSLVQERLVASLSGFFGALALLLAAIGLYGVTSYAVSRRRSEIGIRMALGAQPARVVRMVLARVAWLVAAGVAAGALVTAWAATFVSTLLFGLTPRDPLTLVAAALVLATIGAVSGWLPAWRASKIDPARVLREG
jgi:predicted permease